MQYFIGTLLGMLAVFGWGLVCCIASWHMGINGYEYFLGLGVLGAVHVGYMSFVRWWNLIKMVGA